METTTNLGLVIPNVDTDPFDELVYKTAFERLDSLVGLVRLADAVVGSAVAQVNFTSIPQLYSHLLVVGASQLSANAALQLGFNGDSGANYDGQRLYSLGGTATAANDAGTSLQNIGIGSATNDYFGSLAIFVGDYRGGHQKSAVALAGGKQAQGVGNNSIQVTAIAWRNAAAINAINLVAGGVNFNAGSHFTLWGLV
jgi:hypothetical protein